MFLSNDVNSTGHTSRVTMQGQQFNLNTSIYPYSGDGYSLRVDFTAGGSNETIQFGNGSASQPNRMQFNAFSLQTAAVPEPAALALVLMGIVASIGLRKRA
ncbi:MAG: PEP-CTERM sorting domain-containing protein [Chromatiales bacterium]|jgi:hypothetical protein|nr:PEP-CTERM sorting domain-containing protein [Chromatiales bacterium]